MRIFLKFHITILLRKNGRSKRKGVDNLIDEFGICNAISTQSELGSDLVQLRIEGEEIWKIKHLQVDPIILRFWEKNCLLVVELGLQLLQEFGWILNMYVLWPKGDVQVSA